MNKNYNFFEDIGKAVVLVAGGLIGYSPKYLIDILFDPSKNTLETLEPVWGITSLIAAIAVYRYFDLRFDKSYSKYFEKDEDEDA